MPNPSAPTTASAPAATPARAPWRVALPWGVVPSLCAVCRGWGMQRVCEHCVARYVPAVPRCRRCALALPPVAHASDGARATAPPDLCGRCLVHPPPYERCLAAVGYDHPWDGLIQRFKFHAALDLAPALVERMVVAHHMSQSASTVAAAPLAGASTGASASPSAPAHLDAALPDVFAPVPLGEARLRERGYNQAWEIARRLGAALGVRADAGLLLRLHDRPPQTSLAPTERGANVRGAFAVEPLRRRDVAGRCIGLVDDVVTTGCTASELARCLLDAGAARVQVWAIARTPSPTTG